MNRKNTVASRMSDRFNGSRDIKKQHERIKDLEEKVEALKEAKPSLVTDGFPVKLSQIKSSVQCRKTFTTEMIENRARSLEQEGQLKPFVLIPLPNEPDHYALEDGEVSWRAGQFLEQTKPELEIEYRGVLSKSKDPQEAHFRSLLHHVHSVGLNPLDRATAILADLQSITDFSEEEIVKSLRNAVYHLRNQKLKEAVAQMLANPKTELGDFDPLDVQQLELIRFIHRLQLDLVSFVKNDLSMLDLEADMKQAVRTKDLSCNHALAINRLNGKRLPLDDREISKLRLETVELVLTEKLSVAKTRERVKEIIISYVPEEAPTNDENKEYYRSATASLKSLSILDLSANKRKSLRRLLEFKLQKLEQLDAE